MWLSRRADLQAEVKGGGGRPLIDGYLGGYSQSVGFPQDYSLSLNLYTVSGRNMPALCAMVI